MKKITALILAIVIGLCPIFACADELTAEVVKTEKDSFVLKLTLTSGPTIKVNDKEVKFKPGAYVENGVVYVPVRNVFEGLGMYVTYNEESKILLGVKYNNIAKHIAMQIDTKYFIRCGKLIAYDAAPQLKDDVVFAPANAIYELLGYNVSYDEASETLTVTEK